MTDLDETVRSSLRRLAPQRDPLALDDRAVLDGVRVRRARLVRRRHLARGVTAAAVVAVAGTLTVALVSADDREHVKVASPTTDTSSTQPTPSSTAPPTSASVPATDPVEIPRSGDCTRESIAADLRVPVEHVRSEPECVNGYSLVVVCAEEGEESCPEGYAVLAVTNGRWTRLGHSLQTCVEELVDQGVPPEAAEGFDGFAYCFGPAGLAGAALEPGRLGPIEIGMTVAEIEAAAGLTLEVGDDDISQGCHYVNIVGVDDVYLISGAPQGTSAESNYDVRDTIVGHIYIEGNWETDSGIRVGDPQGEVLAAYPDAEVVPNDYNPNGLWIAWPSFSDPRALAFSIDGSVVTLIQSGYPLPEGCA